MSSNSQDSDIMIVDEIGGTPLTDSQEQITSQDQSNSQVQPTSQETAFTNPRRRSHIYKHFKWLPDKLPNTFSWKCNYCSKRYQQSAGGGTGSLNNHMTSTHKTIFYQTKPGGGTIKSHFPLVNKTSSGEDQLNQAATATITKDGLREELGRFIITTNQPFRIVENEGFKRLLNYVSKEDPVVANMPGQKTMRRSVAATFEGEKLKLKERFQTQKSKISFAVDCWTSPNHHAFQGVTASWISDDWVLHNSMLDLTLLSGSHTGENLESQFSKVLDDFEIWSKMLSVTSDNASNMNSMFDKIDSIAEQKGSTFKSKDHRIRCMAHIINLACQAAIKAVDAGITTEGEMEYDEDEPEELVANSNVISKVRKGVVAIRSTPQREEVFFGQCEAAKLKKKSLIRDVCTRWNYTLNMLERAMELRVAFDMTLQSQRKLEKYKLTEEEWEKVRDLITLLKPFRDATFLLSKSKEPTLSNTTSVYEVLFEHLESYLPRETTNTSYRSRANASPSLSSWLTAAAEAGWNKLKTYYPSSDGMAHVVATVLDPRYKDKWYAAVGWNREWITSCKRTVRSVWTANYKDSGNGSTVIDQQSPTSTRSELENKIIERMKSVQRSNTTDELTKYLQESVVPDEFLYGPTAKVEGVLGWWKLHQQEYPNLSRMAQDFLAISGTGVVVERLFSSATDVITHRRHRLAPETINEILALKAWFKIENENCQEFASKNVNFKIFGEEEYVEEIAEEMPTEELE